MARIKRGVVSKRRHNKLLDLTKGFRGTKSTLIREAKAASLHAGQYAYNGRKERKSDFRSLWIIRIGEAVKQQGLSYSVFIDKLKKSNIELDRKILSSLVLEDPIAFKQVVDLAKKV
ncbi:MAG TPA: 50S ribosomal protein L20 [Candidatus Saccharimonadales bacterium]|nr:50S ribosomal protein L20 [Candidatus Saccharimonadales bacterium]